ncbi:MAG: hypothetical protein RBU30_24680, partial [Polyangia bacterium]|nr:hypothetical protein [Polyangia bacterium]
MMRPLALVSVCLLLASAPGCPKDEIRTPTRYLERPNALDFFCVGPVDDETPGLTALPAYACDEQIEGADRRAIFGVLSNSARSEVALVNVTRGQLVDLMNQNPGYGFIPVGEAPVGVQVTEDGCAAYVTNHGSCDISLVNLNAALHVAGLELVEGSLHGAPTGRIGIRSASGRLLARPHSLVLVPEHTEELPPIQACGPIKGHRAYVSIPSCGLVAVLDLGSGRILQSFRLTASGLVPAGTDPSCPRDCVDFVGDSAPEGTLAEHQPGPIHVTWDGMRLLIGWMTAPALSILDVDPFTGELVNPRTLPLAEEERGVLRIRETLTWTSDWHFLYVITRSGVVHVIDGDLEEECETNPDPTDPFFPEDGSDPSAWEAWSHRRGCLRLSDPTTPERAPGIQSPALALPGMRKAVDVAFVELEEEGYDEGTSLTTLNPRRLVGTFAYLVSQDGNAYLVNVDENFAVASDPGTPETPLQHRRGDGVHAVLAHQLRSAVNTLPDEDGRPRATDGQTQGIYQDGEPLVDDGTHDRLAKRPGGNEPAISALDPYRVRTESFHLRYEGVLPGTQRITGQVIRHDLGSAPSGQAEFVDSGLPFCQYGVRDGDLLVLVGCSSAKECGDGYYCYRSFLQAAGSSGICLSKDTEPGLESHCEDLTLSRREYVIARAEGERLFLAPREMEDASPCGSSGLERFCCDALGDVVGISAGAGLCLAGPLPDASRDVVVGDAAIRTAHCFEG